MIDSSKRTPSFLSLFCGCGGLDLGFISAGYKGIAAFDIDPLAVEVYNRNLEPIARTHNLENGCYIYGPYEGIDVMLSGTPCQGFSTAGKRKFDDPRNNLLLIAGKRAIKIKPTVFVVENVRGVISGDHKKYWNTLRHMLNGAGYKTTEALIDVSSLVAQTRKRMVMIAWNNGRHFKLPSLSGDKKTLKDALSDINGAQNHDVSYFDDGSDITKIAKNIKPGQKLCDVRGGPRAVHTWDIPNVFGKVSKAERDVLTLLIYLRRKIRVRNYGDADPLSVSDISETLGQNSLPILENLRTKGFVRKIGEKYDLTHAFNGKYRRLRWEEPSTTVDTRFIDPRYFIHPEGNRGFTIREAARIQGFPDSYTFYGHEKDQCRLVGNAVPPPLARWIAEIILSSLLK